MKLNRFKIWQLFANDQMWSCLKRYSTPATLATILGFCVLVASAASLSDQNDPRLDALFERLLAATDPQVGNEITDDIWEIWRDAGDPEINSMMVAGVSAMQSGRLRMAASIFNQIVDRAPNFAEGWNKRATVRYFLRDYENSAADVRKTLALEPRHFGAMAGLGLIFLQIEYYESALQAFEDALEINPHLIGPKQQIRRIKKFLLDDPV